MRLYAAGCKLCRRLYESRVNRGSVPLCFLLLALLTWIVQNDSPLPKNIDFRRPNGDNQGSSWPAFARPTVSSTEHQALSILGEALPCRAHRKRPTRAETAPSRSSKCSW